MAKPTIRMVSSQGMLVGDDQKLKAIKECPTDLKLWTQIQKASNYRITNEIKS